MTYSNMVERIAYEWQTGIYHGLIREGDEENNAYFTGKVVGMIEAVAQMECVPISEVYEAVYRYSKKHGLMLQSHPLF